MGNIASKCAGIGGAAAQGLGANPSDLRARMCTLSNQCALSLHLSPTMQDVFWKFFVETLGPLVFTRKSAEETASQTSFESRFLRRGPSTRLFWRSTSIECSGELELVGHLVFRLCFFLLRAGEVVVG